MHGQGVKGLMSDSIDSTCFLQTVSPLLAGGDASVLASAVSARWRPTQLKGLLDDRDVEVRRIAAVTIGLVGGREAIDWLVAALHDVDEQVNRMAEHGLWAIWFRCGSPEAAGPFRRGMAMIAAERYPEAIACFDESSAIDPTFAEASNQCAIAHWFLYQWQQAIADCQRSLTIEPRHFGSLASLGHCYAQLGQLHRALDCYQRAMRINPRMDGVRAAVNRLDSHVAKHGHLPTSRWMN